MMASTGARGAESRTKAKNKARTGGTFWKLTAAVLCAVQVFQYAFVHFPTVFGRRATANVHEWGGAKARPLVSFGDGASSARGLPTAKPGVQPWAPDGSEDDIDSLHERLQAICGHRGLPAGDKHHIDSRKGPTAEVVSLLARLEAAYRKKLQQYPPTFQPPSAQQSDGTAMWRKWEFSCFSQCGDDGLLYRIFGILGWGNRRSVEIGYFPHEANSVNLIVNANFSGLLLDGNTDPLVAKSWYATIPDYLDIVHANHQLPRSEWTFKEPTEADLSKRCAPYCLKACYNVNCYKGSTMTQQPHIQRSLVTLENIQGLIDGGFPAGSRVRGPRALDYFSIDIDGMDYYLLDSLLSNGYAPRVVATEYAAHMGQELALTRPYSPTFAAAATSFQYGASLAAFVKLLKRHDYRFIGCVEWNAYFIRNDELASEHASSAFPELQLATCFYQDYDSRMTEVVRRRKACQVEWVEVEVEEGRQPRPWSELKALLLDSLAQVWDTHQSPHHQASGYLCPWRLYAFKACANHDASLSPHPVHLSSPAEDHDGSGMNKSSPKQR